jgi:hypothetical protein
MNIPPADSGASDRPKRRTPGFPIKIAEWRRNRQEVVRVSIDYYDGSIAIDARIWWRDFDGNFKPKQKGLRLPIAQLPKLANAVSAALKKAKSLYLIEEKRGKQA